MLLDTMEWKRVTCTGEVPLERHSHSAVVYKNQMIVFGGLGVDRFLKDMCVLNLGSWSLISF